MHLYVQLLSSFFYLYAEKFEIFCSIIDHDITVIFTAVFIFTNVKLRPAKTLGYFDPPPVFIFRRAIFTPLLKTPFFESLAQINSITSHFWLKM